VTEAAIRRCRRDEIPAVLALWREAEARPSATDDPGALATLLERDRESLLVADAGGEVVGAVIAAWDGWRGNLYRLAVAPAHRRRGLGTRLVRTAEELLRARGARRITALVAASDDSAAAFWPAVGYDRDERIARHVRTLPSGG
jgi:ribosomal protein S18 acetylase RimI-like enzyme